MPRQSDGYSKLPKRLLDVVLVLLALPVALPLIGLCALAIWLEGGSPFYRQDRLGQNGRVFSLFKLRTMVRDADARLEACLDADPAMRAEWEATQKLKCDPRITRLGAFLRKTSLDELPQLLNVLLGDMSLVGPRPMLPEQLPLYGNPASYFALKPGITGLWQVSGRNDTRFDARQIADARYHANVSIWSDLEIMVKTLGVVARRTGY
ncbi:MAG: sugar transferase [Rhodobacteraceae bacterium]|nr:sugar transferase [Paracoccaceae bacterium]